MAEEKRKTKVLSMPRVKLEKPGDTVQGYLLGLNDVEGKKGLYKEAMVRKEDGTGAFTIALGVSAQKVLALIAVGEWFKLTLTGTSKTAGGNFVNEYQIEVADED